MRRASVLIAVLVACLTIASIAVAAKKKGKRVNVRSAVTLQIANSPNNGFSPGAVTYSGAVTASGPEECRSARPVTISGNGVPLTDATTDPDGTYRATVAAAAAPGSYTASVEERRITVKRKGKKKTFVCSEATSAAVAVP
jgi:hypothetical protein